MFEQHGKQMFYREEVDVARRVQEFPALPSQSKYPWDEWLDGSVWEFIVGEDFNGRPETFRSMAKTHAKKRGGRVRSRMLRTEGQPDRLYLQFERRESDG